VASKEELADTELPSDGPLDALLAEVARPPSALAAGARVGRFEILRPLGQGGMGTVYEARDSTLGRRVALKVVRVERESAATLELFKNEAESVARLNHPNIVTVYEFGMHEGVPFMILELLQGESLQQRLARGPLRAREAVEVMTQVLRGLGHAHGLGVIHCDLKPANLFVRTDGQVKILDFGVAAFIGKLETLTAGRTPRGRAPSGGTPAYMAPEQQRGAPTDARTDIYSAGLTLHQLVTGKLPPEGKAPTWLARTIAKATAPEPAQRFQRVDELGAALRPRRRWPWIVASLAALTVALALLRPHAPGRPDRRTLAILGLRNLGGDAQEDWIGPALAEMLTTELGADGKLRLVSSEEVAHARRELNLEPGTLAPATLARVRGLLGAEAAVVGSYMSSEETLRVDVRMEDTETGEIVALARQGSAKDLVGLATMLATDLRGRLGVVATSGRDLPGNTEAARLYAEARQKLFDFECTAARDLAERVVEADGRFVHGRLVLAAAWECLGYEQRARDEAKRAFDGAGELSERDRLLVEARYRKLNHERDHALEIYRTLWREYPDDLEIGLELVQFSDSGEESLLAALKKLPPPLGDSPRVDLAEAEIMRNRDVLVALAAARRAEEKARARGADGLLAAALIAEVDLDMDDGRSADARAAAAAARSLAVKLGDRELLARSLLLGGYTQMAAGHFAAAEPSFAQGLALARELGDGVLIMRALHFLGWDDMRRCRLARARAGYEEMVAIAHEVGSARWTAVAKFWLGDIALVAGDAIEARRFVDEALALFREQHIDIGFDYQPYDLMVAEDRLDEVVSERDARLQSIEKLRTRRIERNIASAEYSIPAGRSAEVEARLRTALDELPREDQEHRDIFEPWARANLAWALAAQGKAREATIEADAADAGLARTESSEQRVDVRLAIARARTAIGDKDRARVAIQAALAEADGLGVVSFALEARLLLAQLDHDRKALAALADEAARRGFVRTARLAREVR
jgi:serine/threonine protein kinase